MHFFRFTSSVTPPPDLPEAAFWFIVQEDRVLVQPAGDAASPPWVNDPINLGLITLQRHYMGFVEDGAGQKTHCYAAEIAADASLPPGFVADGLRQLYPLLGEQGFRLAGAAVQLVEWARTHRFCGRCGAEMEMASGERAMKCPTCGLSSYPRLSPAVITAVVRRDGNQPRILLARNHRFPAGRYSVVAGFVEPGESLEECVQREVTEEVGVQVTNLRYFGSQPWPFPHSLMVGFTADYAGGEITLEEAEIADAQWFAADNLPQLPPKLSIARRLIDWFVEQNS
jgi:NAD+ diphosphatase